MPTLKTGSPVIIKNTGEASAIANIENGRYLLANKEVYWSHEITAIKQKPVPKKKTSIRQVSAFQSVLNEIYKIIHLEYMAKNTRCLAKLDGCTHKATQLHHKFKRTGYYLVMDQFFLPICSNCHHIVTEDSDFAIEIGLSISRLSEIPYEFSDRTMELLLEFEIKLP